MRAPRSASHTLIGTSQCTLSPFRRKKGCSPTRVLTIKSPRGPPNGPAFPSSVTRICAPESTPAGTATSTGSTTRRTPRPRHIAQRPPWAAPLAAQAVQGENRGTSICTLAPRATSAKDSSTTAWTSSPRRPAPSASSTPAAGPIRSYICRAAGSPSTRKASAISLKSSRARSSQKLTSGEYCRASR